MRRPAVLSVLFLGVLGCSSTPTPATDAAVTDAPLSDASETSVAIERGPAQINVDGDPNGLWWDAASRTLYLADDDNNRILTWRDGVGLRALTTLPAGTTNGAGLGQLVRTAEGVLAVARFGDGTAGGIVYVTADGTTGEVPTLDVTRRRIGLSVAADGTLYSAWFLRQGSGRVGSISAFELQGGERAVVTGLSKPVGILAVGAQLYVSDQDRNEVLVYERANPTTMRRHAMLTGPDLMCEGPNGSLFVGSTMNVVYRVASDGAVTTFDTGYRATRGVAYDAVGRRLFVADHDANDADGTQHVLRIVPVDG